MNTWVWVLSLLCCCSQVCTQEGWMELGSVLGLILSTSPSHIVPPAPHGVLLGVPFALSITRSELSSSHRCVEVQ